jgi:hypothetical protein
MTNTYHDAFTENFDSEKTLNHLSLEEINTWVKTEICHPVPDGLDANGYHYKIVCEEVVSPVIFCENDRTAGTVRRSVDLVLWREFIDKVKSLNQTNL